MSQQRWIPFDEFTTHIRAIFDRLTQEQEPIIVEKEGKFYKLTPTDEQPQDMWAGYDPEKVRRGLQASAGALAGVDRTTLLADIHAQRKQAPRKRTS